VTEGRGIDTARGEGVSTWHEGRKHQCVVRGGGVDVTRGEGGVDVMRGEGGVDVTRGEGGVDVT
jgi:hypothetical protein